VADIDVKVLYLETPSVSAPQASYTIGVRMRNEGIHPRSSAGVVSVYDKGSGLLIQTFQVASAIMGPGEEKQAFSTLQLDLRLTPVDTELLFSGAITCDGDMVPANNILNPTTVKVTAEPPPPPPPVAAHASQHRDGGSDELDVTGLYGVLGTPQPYADHAAAHQLGGDDQLSLAGLPGQLADPQIAASHGNERHVVDFLYESELTNHVNDATPHDAATSLEKTANKGEADGYAELDAAARVPVDRLGSGSVPGTRFLRDDQSWQEVAGSVGDIIDSAPAWRPYVGIIESGARRDHLHTMPGGMFTMSPGSPLGSGTTTIMWAWIPPRAERQPNFTLGLFIFGRIIGPDSRTVDIELEIGCAETGWLSLCTVSAVIAPALDGAPFRYKADLVCLNPAPPGSVAAVAELMYPTQSMGAWFACSPVLAAAAPSAWFPDLRNYVRVHLTAIADIHNYVIIDGGDCLWSLASALV